MKQKIVIITSKYLHPFVEKAFEDFKEDCTVTIADYTNFDHITDIYRKYEKTADGFMISGTTAMPCNVGTDVEVYSDHVTVKAFFQKHDQPFIFSVHCSEATSINPSRKLTPPVFSLSFRYLCTPPRHCISQNCFIEYFYIL